MNKTMAVLKVAAGVNDAEEEAPHLVCRTSGEDESDKYSPDPLEEVSPATASVDRVHRNIGSITAALCFCMMAHSYLLISVFPYSGYMAVDLISSLDVENAGSYAGILASTLMIGRATTAYGWGKVADAHGRTTVLCLSLAIASVLSFLFGFSPSYGWALLIRFCLGMSNGILGTLRTTVSEIARGDEKLETRTMMIVMGMWSWGFLVSPAISGALSDPTRQFPNSKWIPQSGWAHALLKKYPFVLPNLVGSTLCSIAFGLVMFSVRETLPKHEQKSARQMLEEFFCSIWCLKRRKSYEVVENTVEVGTSDGFQDEAEAIDFEREDSELGCNHDQDGRMNEIDEDTSESTVEENATIFSIIARGEARMYLLVNWAASFVSVAFNEVFPLFCMSQVAGLALSERHIGQILSLSGFIFAISQYGAQSVAYKRFGLLGSLRAGAVVGSPIVFLVPFSLLLNRGSETGHIEVKTMLFLALILAINRVCTMVFYSNMAVAMNRSVPPDQRATAQGVCGMGENLARGLGPMFAGVLSSSSVRMMGKFGSILTFGTIGAIGTLFALCTVFYLRDASVINADDGVVVESEVELERFEQGDELGT